MGVAVDASGHDPQALCIDVTPPGWQVLADGGNGAALNANIGHKGVLGGADTAVADGQIKHGVVSFSS